MTVQDDRGFLLKFKLLLPERLWRLMTKPAAFVLRQIPLSLKYEMGLTRRRSKMPYSVIGKDDVVFQIGAPSDLLSVGRSRAGYFLKLVSGEGRLVVMEPDNENCDALKKFAEKIGKAGHLLVVNAGGWSEAKELIFYQSREHPASAVLADLSEATEAEMKRRNYQRMTVPVTTVDKVIDEHKLKQPKLVSITTNGAEIEILSGMKNTFKNGGAEYISLAITGDGYREEMKKLSYTHVADDDRGFTFVRRDQVNG